MVEYRAPYPTWREQLYWLYRKYVRRESIPAKAWVTLTCPNSDGVVIATEHTDPTDVQRDAEIDRKICTYDCPECQHSHRWLWGPPAPIILTDA